MREVILIVDTSDDSRYEDVRGTHVNVVIAVSYLADRICGTFSSAVVPS